MKAVGRLDYYYVIRYIFAHENREVDERWILNKIKKDSLISAVLLFVKKKKAKSCKIEKLECSRREQNKTLWSWVNNKRSTVKHGR